MKIINKNKNKYLLSAIFLLIIVAFPVSAQTITSKEVINLTNQSRTQRNLPPLLENEILDEAAKQKAFDMIENDYFSHTSPDDITPWYWFRANGYEYKYAGENLAINYEDSSSQHTAWMNSITHRENILDPNYQETGAAVLEGKIKSKDVIISVQLFAQPKNQTLSQKYSMASGKNNQLLLLAYSDTYRNRTEHSASLEPGNYYKKDKEKSLVLSARIKSQNNTTKNLIAIMTLIALGFVVHINIISSINPKRVHHIAATNIILIMIIFSMLGL